MADVKWIKIVTDIFDDEKMLLIESMPEADGIIVIWFKLLCMAGKQNNSGVFMLNDKIAYTDEMLATVFRRPLNTVRLALKTFETYGMIEIVDNVVTIPNWEKHQNLDKLEQAKEKNRKRVAAHRERQKLLAQSNDYSNVSVTPCNDIDIDIEEDKERDKDKERDISIPQVEQPPSTKSEPIDYELFKDTYNKFCSSLSQIRMLSDKRKKAIKAFLKQLEFRDFEMACKKANESNFLTGRNDRGWKADFDFIIRVDKALSIIEGKYDINNLGGFNNGGSPNGDTTDTTNQARYGVTL